MFTRNLLLLLCIILTGNIYAAVISYETDDFGSGRWQYDYIVANNNLPELSAFTVFFDYDLYDHLSVVSSPAGWDSQVFQPDSFLGDGGMFDAAALAGGLSSGESAAFSVSFDYLGIDTPGSQYYEVYDPTDYTEAIEDGYTVPEPATLLAFGIGGLMLRKRRRS